MISARVVHRYVIEQIDDPRFQPYVVWGPMLDKEKEADARRASRYVPDPRSAHFWTADHALAEQFQQSLGLEHERAWDTFLLFAPGVRWGDGEAAPSPTDYMHKGKDLPEEKSLNGEVLRQRVEELLEGEPAPSADAGGRLHGS